MALRYAVDTNVLLRLSIRNHPHHDLIRQAMLRLGERDTEFCFTPQNLGEFWNVSTRGRENNGFGLTVEETEAHLRSIERVMTLLPDDEVSYREWRRLLFAHGVQGVQVHDAHLAAVLKTHGVTHLLTFNTGDFKRYPWLNAVHPGDIR